MAIMGTKKKLQGEWELVKAGEIWWKAPGNCKWSVPGACHSGSFQAKSREVDNKESK
jgi:hypothetical protein